MADALLQAVLAQQGGTGYREALATYLVANLDKLRTIASRKLDRSNRAVFDSDEVVSSVVRRLDTLAQRGAIRATSEEELWALIVRIVSNATISRIRLIEVARRHLSDDGPYVSMLIARVGQLETDDEASLFVYRLVSIQEDATDRQILLLRMRGMTMAIIADQLGLSESAIKMRYKRVCDRLEELFNEGAFHGEA